MVRCSSYCWSRYMSDWSCHTRSVQTMIHLKPSNPIDEPTTPDSNNREQSCHDTLPWLISFQLDASTHEKSSTVVGACLSNGPCRRSVYRHRRRGNTVWGAVSEQA